MSSNRVLIIWIQDHLKGPLKEHSNQANKIYKTIPLYLITYQLFKALKIVWDLSKDMNKRKLKNKELLTLYILKYRLYKFDFNLLSIYL